MLRDQTPTAAYLFETPYGLERAGGESDKPGYRRQFPMKTGDLGKRWCSAYTKTHVGECTRHHRVLALRDGDPADPSFPRTPVRPASRVHRAGRAPLRSDRGVQARDDRAARGVDRPRPACGTATGRGSRGSAVRAWTGGARGCRRRHAGPAAPSAAGVSTRQPQAPERTRGCNRTRSIDPIHLDWARYRRTCGATYWEHGRRSCSRSSGPARTRRPVMNDKIQSTHLERRAVVYPRQSDPRQVRNHPESTARQYALKQHAIELGWPAERVEIIDEDLGQSAAGTERRDGFKRLAEDVGPRASRRHLCARGFAPRTLLRGLVPAAGSLRTGRRDPARRAVGLHPSQPG